MDISAKEITQDQLIRSIKASNEPNSSIRYGFILGAGASINSKIPSGNELAEKWYKELKEDISDNALKIWQDSISGFDESKISESYTKIFEKRFEANYQAGYQELQKYMDRARPSIGYSFLAQLLDETPNKFVITTNFDTMTEDALFEFKKSRPLVLGHELLSNYINPTSPSRPTIIKIHRDFLFDPYNTDGTTKTLDEQWEKALKPVLMENAIIVLGYGGNDDSLMNYLKNIQDRKPIYWCHRGDKSGLSDKIKGVLTKQDFTVSIKGFDQFMLLVNDRLGFEPLIDRENIDNSQIIKNAIEYAETYKRQLERLGESSLDDDGKRAIEKLLPSWWEFELEARNEKDLDKKDVIYNQGLKKIPNSHELMCNYAIFLDDSREEYDEAEKYYKKALELNPDGANNNGNYAFFLHNIRKEYDEAERYYKRALELNPDGVNKNGNYALFLHNIRKEYDEAERYYKKALELESDDANNNGNYALFLHNIRKEYDEAERYYKKALELESDDANNNGNYAQHLLAQGRKAESVTFLEKAFKNDQTEGDLTVELWFYRLAHFPEYFEEAKIELDRLLEDGHKSIGWDLSENITQAEKEGFKDIRILEDYAKRITDL